MTSRLSGPETMIRYLSPFLFPSTRNSDLGEGFKRIHMAVTFSKSPEDHRENKQQNTNLIGNQRRPTGPTWHDTFLLLILLQTVLKYDMTLYLYPDQPQTECRKIPEMYFYLQPLQVTLENVCSWLKEECPLSKILDISKAP